MKRKYLVFLILLSATFFISIYNGCGDNGRLSGSLGRASESISSGLKAKVMSANQIDLSWPKSSETDVVGFKVFRNGFLIAMVNSLTTTYSSTGLTPATTYTYQVSVFDAAGNESSPSTPVTATTLP